MPATTSLKEMLVCCVIIALACVLDRLLPRRFRSQRPVQVCWVQIFYYLAVLVISVVISAALAPKPKPPPAQKGTIPTVKDGKRVIRVYGTVWIDDPTQLAMMQVGQDPIKKKGGKK